MSTASRFPAFLREWREWRRFRAMPRAERRIVFFSESRQDWHHFARVIRYLTEELGQTVLYVSSDPEDPGLTQPTARIVPFCVGKGLWRIWFFQFLDADMLVTQILDLGNLELKRSVHRVHYVYMFHSLISTHMADRADSFDHYDTILCAGPHQLREIRRREELHDLPPKQLVAHGYARLEDLLQNRREPPPADGPDGIHVLLAPSWGDETILPVCGLELTGVLLEAGYRVTLRPHYQTRWMTPGVIDRIAARYGNHPRFVLVDQMAESDSLYDSHVMVTDWSGAAHDYGMGLEKPVLFIDVPPKARNTAWPELGIEPFESAVRPRLGSVLSPQRIGDAPAAIRGLLADPARFRRDIEALRLEGVFNGGRSGQVGAEAIARIAAAVAGDAGRTSATPS